MDSTPDEILIVGSSRVRGLRWRRYPGYWINIAAKGGLTHEELIKIVDEKITEKTVLIILVCLQVELHSRTLSPSGEPGMVFANVTPNVEKIVYNLSTADHRWKKTRNVHVIWVAPYTPNLLLLNEVRKRARGWGSTLHHYEKEMSNYHMTVIDENRRRLVDKMKSAGLVVSDLTLLPHHLTREGDSDGLHLSDDAKFTLFAKVIEEGICFHKSGPPVVREVGLLLDPEVREAVTQVRRHKRRQQRTRAAEREIFKQLQIQKDDKKNNNSTAPEA